MTPWNRLLENFARLYLDTFTNGLRVAGRGNIWPGPKIVIMNHADVSTVFALPAVFPEPLYFLAQGDVFDVPVVGLLLRRAGHIPLWPGKGAQALAEAAERLATGGAIALCPEGRQSPAGGYARPQTGAVRLALATGAPIVPVGGYVAPEHMLTFRGRFRGQDRLGHWQFGGPCHVRVGPAWYPPAGVKVSAALVRRLTNEVFGQVISLVGQARLASLAAPVRHPAPVVIARM